MRVLFDQRDIIRARTEEARGRDDNIESALDNWREHRWHGRGEGLELTIDYLPDDTQLERIAGGYRIADDQPDGWAERREQISVASMLDDIDRRAGEVREQYITTVSGQEGTYLLKREQARDYIAAGSPDDLTDYPMIQARADAYDQTPTEAAKEILRRAAQWTQVGSAIERAREAGKRAVKNAADDPGRRAARDAALSALDELKPQ